MKNLKLFISLIFLFITIFSTQAQDIEGREKGPPEDSLEMVILETIDAEEEIVPVPEPSEKAMRYYRSGNLLWFFSLLWGLLIPALILFTGFSAKMRNWAGRFGKNWFLTILFYWIIFNLLTYAIDFGLAYYEGFLRPHSYDLSNQTFSKWLGDSLKSLMVSIIGGGLFIWVPYLLLKRSPKRWWLYSGLLAVPFLLFLILIQPVYIDPLFNDFGEMKDKELEAKILAVADRAGIEGSRVYEVNKSVDTEQVNAYVTGFGNTKRIVLWDTIIEKLDEEELLFVMGHEMGHFVLGHVMSLILILSIIIMATLFAIYKTADILINRYKDRFGFTEMSDIASLPLLLLLFSLYFLLITPILMGVSRHNEHEADRFGLEITQKNAPAARAFAKLQEENLGNPRPGLIYKIFRASHPPLGERIDFCNSYHPWKEGKELEYGDLFREE